jgi:hypothetical protein
MPHQCVRCGKVISGGSRELLEGCDSCNGKFFFYMKNKEVEKKSKEVRKNLSTKEIKEMEKDVRKLIRSDKKDKTVILDLATVKTVGPGKFEIDISALMRGEPVVINISDGKYFIDLPSAFKEEDTGEVIKHLK